MKHRKLVIGLVALAVCYLAQLTVAVATRRLSHVVFPGDRGVTPQPAPRSRWPPTVTKAGCPGRSGRRTVVR